MQDVIERFLSLNKARFEKTLEILPSRQRPYLQVLPFLFHANEPSLPGYIPGKAPEGVSGFIVDEPLNQTIKKLWRGFRYQTKPYMAVDIEAIFLMGSCGTIAFNGDSDLDVWICYRPELDKEQIRQLQQKSTDIERWYAEQGLDVHFFLMNAVAFKQGKVVRLSSESSGSAQYHLLLDEFYRTSIWVAGKKPLWWRISPEEEKSYEKTKKALIEKGKIDPKEYIDFGGLPAIPKSEFFGAAVWQIYKGIDSPYKSVLKITLMEAYAESYPEIIPLSVNFKQKIYSDDVDPISLDPYLMMINRIENYLRRKSELARLEIARRSFYLKLSMHLSKPNEIKNWRQECVENLVFNQWKWNAEKLERLDSSKKWRIEDVIAERKLLVSHLTNSYAFLSKFARKHSSRRLIKPKDLTILGRKLYSAFDRKAGKIEIFNRGIAENIAEDSVTFRLFVGKEKQEYWHVYRGKVIGDKYKEVKPLKYFLSLIELLAWCYANNVVSSSTQKLMYAPGSELGNNELNTLTGIISKLVGPGKVMTPPIKALIKPAVMRKGAVFVNIGKQPKLGTANIDKKIVSGEIDVFNYGDNQTMVETIEYIYVTSWKEMFVFKYAGVEGMANWLCAALNMYKESLGQSKSNLKISSDVYSFGSSVSHVLSKRISELYKSVMKKMLKSDEKKSIYIYQAARQFFCISYVDDHFEYSKYSNLEKLLEFLSTPNDNFTVIHFDPYLRLGLPLADIYEYNSEGSIQLFCYEEKENTHMLIIDENSALHYQKLPLDHVRNILSHYNTFFSHVLGRKNIDETVIESEILSPDVDQVLKMYQVSGNKAGYVVDPINLRQKDSTNELEIQVIGEQIDNKPIFTFYCNDVEFSTTEHGNAVFDKVAEYIIERRNGNKDYYLYITDLELSPALLGKKMSHRVQTMELLKYKKRIESKLNKNTRR